MKFKIGDRVRIKIAYYPHNQVLVGKESIITATEKSTWGIAYGLEISPINWHEGYRYGWSEEQLEPILAAYDGNTMTEWDELTSLLGCDIRRFATQTESV